MQQKINVMMKCLLMYALLITSIGKTAQANPKKAEQVLAGPTTIHQTGDKIYIDKNDIWNPMKPILKSGPIKWPFELNCSQEIAAITNTKNIPDDFKQNHIYWFEETEYGYCCLYKRFVPEDEYGAFMDDAIHIATFDKSKKLIADKNLSTLGVML